MKRPPMGVMPRWLHDEIRRDALRSAIFRRLDATLPLPAEWVAEYNELTTKGGVAK